MNQHPIASPAYQAFADEQPEQHHGDLRKGAYLQRRAAYQLEAGKPFTAQAGDPRLTTGHRKSRQAG